MSPILILLLNSNCKPGVVSQTLNVNPTLFVNLYRLSGAYRFTDSQLLSLTKCSFIQFQSSFNNILLQVDYKRR